MTRRSTSRFLLVILFLGSIAPAGLAQQQDDTKVNTTGPVSTTQGTTKIKPAQGNEGTGASYNFLPYSLPGQFPNPDTQRIENQPFDISYTSRTQPVQTSDWWSGIGLQWSNDQHTVGWVIGRSAAEGTAGRSRGFIAEPFTMNFIDYGDSPANDILGIKPLPAGLRLWNPNKLSVQNKGQATPSDKFDASNNYAGFGNAAEPSPAVTVGLAGVHPLGTDVRTQAPWSNVKVQRYSDWGVVVSYMDTPGEMTVTMAEGSPFVWSNPNTVLLHPYFVSQDASPLINRASWVKPPYVFDESEPPPAGPCTTVCFPSPDQYLLNLDRLPRGTVLIARGGIGDTISTSNRSAMRWRSMGSLRPKINSTVSLLPLN